MAQFGNTIVQREAERIRQTLRLNAENLGKITSDGAEAFTFRTGGNIIEASVSSKGEVKLFTFQKLPTNFDKQQIANSVCLLNLCLDFAKIVLSFDDGNVSLVAVFRYSDSIFSPTALCGWENQFVKIAEIVFADVGKIASGQNLEYVANALCEVSGVGDRKSAIDCLSRFAECTEKRHWQALSDDGNLFLNVLSGSKCVNLSFTYSCDYSYILIVAVFPFGFVNCKAQCATLVCRLNAELQYGSLDFDSDTGKLFYRSGLPVAKCLIAESLCNEITDICCQEAFEVYDKLQSILLG